MRRNYGDETREWALQLAAQLFTERGYAPTRLQDIADAMDVSKSGLYHHFPSKETLLHALTDDVLDDLDTLLAAVPAGPLQTATCRALLTSYVDLLLHNCTVATFLVRDEACLARIDGVGPRWAEQTARLRSLLASLGGGDLGPARTAAALGAIWGAVTLAGGQADIASVRGPIVAAAMAALSAAERGAIAGLLTFRQVTVEPPPAPLRPDGRPAHAPRYDRSAVAPRWRPVVAAMTEHDEARTGGLARARTGRFPT